MTDLEEFKLRWEHSAKVVACGYGEKAGPVVFWLQTHSENEREIIKTLNKGAYCSWSWLVNVTEDFCLLSIEVEGREMNIAMDTLALKQPLDNIFLRGEALVITDDLGTVGEADLRKLNPERTFDIEHIGEKATSEWVQYLLSKRGGYVRKPKKGRQ